jgi:hypothetical protein
LLKSTFFDIAPSPNERSFFIDSTRSHHDNVPRTEGRMTYYKKE